MFFYTSCPQLVSICLTGCLHVLPFLHFGIPAKQWASLSQPHQKKRKTPSCVRRGSCLSQKTMAAFLSFHEREGQKQFWGFFFVSCETSWLFVKEVEKKKRILWCDAVGTQHPLRELHTGSDLVKKIAGIVLHCGEGGMSRVPVERGLEKPDGVLVVGFMVVPWCGGCATSTASLTLWTEDNIFRLLVQKLRVLASAVRL